MNKMSWFDWVMWSVVFGLLAKLLVVFCKAASRFVFGTEEESRKWTEIDDKMRADDLATEEESNKWTEIDDPIRAEDMRRMAEYMKRARPSH